MTSYLLQPETQRDTEKRINLLGVANKVTLCPPYLQISCLQMCLLKCTCNSKINVPGAFMLILEHTWNRKKKFKFSP